MTRAGPFLRLKPNIATTTQHWVRCWLLLTDEGEVFAILWEE